MKKQMKSKEKEFYSSWVFIISIALICVTIVGSIRREEFWISIVGACISLFSAFKCRQWAIKIKSNETLAWFIGLLLSVLGLIGYYLYYMSKRR